MSIPYTQIRIARPTAKLEEVRRFYKEGLGLPEIGQFQDHAGYSGVMLGMPDARYHLEFTQHHANQSLYPPDKDQLLVFYLPDTAQRDAIVQRLQALGYKAVAPENPYWTAHGITIEDPDGWRVVLMDVRGFEAAA